MEVLEVKIYTKLNYKNDESKAKSAILLQITAGLE